MLSSSPKQILMEQGPPFNLCRHLIHGA